jgi:lysophospholipase L1-like esterase
MREKHPDTKIYCISMTYTTQLNSKKSKISVDDFRKVVREVVAKRQNNGDKNLFLVKGEDLTTKANLKDKVHFSVDGAKLFADALYQEIK